MSDHAVQQYRARVDPGGMFKDIETAIRESSKLHKGDVGPFPFARRPHTVYAHHNDALYVMEPIGSGDYRLITVIHREQYLSRLGGPTLLKRRKKQRT